MPLVVMFEIDLQKIFGRVSEHETELWTNIYAAKVVIVILWSHVELGT